MKKKEKKELNAILQSPYYLDLEPEKAMQIAKRLINSKKILNNQLKKIDIAILTNFNLDLIKNSINFCLYQRGLDATIYSCDYGTLITELLNPESKTYQFKPEYILIWPTYRDMQKIYIFVLRAI